MNKPLSNQTIGGAGMAATAGGGLLSAFGSISSGIANEGMYNYQASIAKINEQIDAQNAEYALQTGRQQNQQFGFKAGQQMGQIKTAEASSGFDVRSGSAAQVQASQRGLDRLDMEVLHSNAAKTAYNYEIQGTMEGAQASLYQKAGSNALAAGFVGAGSSLLGGAASVSSEWLQGQRVGLWGGGGGPSTGDDSYTRLFGG